MKDAYNDRSMRLECVKHATLTIMQTRGKPADVLPLAQRFYEFITNGEDDEDATR